MRLERVGEGGESGADEFGSLELTFGRITVKEALGADTPIFSARGILAEFKIVGVFECAQNTEPV